MKTPRKRRDDEQNSWECVGCDLPLPLNDLGLCAECAAKLERDLIRARDWEYTTTAFFLSAEQQEALRARIIREYGAKNELLVEEKPKSKPKHTHSRATQRKREIATQAIREYSTDDVLQAAHDFIQAQTEPWVNFSRVLQHLYERFYHLKPKRLGAPGKKYKSLLKFIADYPDRFQLRSEADQGGVYWIRLSDG
ncbi:MAG: hypothetical protein IAE80_09035 [Anaerolinea sp.]|nr:hypothetical protein [Anaerolinea sp.]